MRIWNANAKCEYNMEDLLIKHITHHPRDANYEDDVLHSLATIKKINALNDSMQLLTLNPYNS